MAEAAGACHALMTTGLRISALRQAPQLHRKDHHVTTNAHPHHLGGTPALGRRTFTALSTACLLTGCEAFKLPSSSLPASLADAATEARSLQVPNSGVLVVLSYPVRFAPGAEQVARSAYLRAQLGAIDGQDWPEGFDAAMQKTAWLSADFYQELSQRLPPGQVILRPAEVIVQPDGGLASRIVGGELPAVVRVDFLAYAMPGLNSFSGRHLQPRGIGRFMTPLVAVSTSQAASSLTNGALAGLDGLPPPVVADGAQPSILGQLAMKAAGRSSAAIPSSSERPAVAGRYLSLPLVEFEYEEAEWANYAMDPVNRPSPARRYLAPYAAMVAEILRSIDQQVALRTQQRSFNALYDPAARDTDLPPARARLLERFADAERRFLHQVGSGHAELVGTGDFARAMAHRVNAEDDMLARARRADMLGAALILTGGLAGLAAGGAALTPGVLSTFSQTMDTTRAIVSAHDLAFQGADRSQRAILVNLGSSERAITAQSLDDFRAQLRRLYATARSV